MFMRPYFLLLLLFMPENMKAQVITDIGIKAGHSFSYLRNRWPASVSRSDQKIGNFAMISINSFPNERFSLYTDLGFIQKGNSFTILDGSVHEATWDFLSLSPMMKYRIPIGSFSPYAFLGPRLDFLTGWRTNYGATSSTLLQEPYFGVSYGLGMEWVVKNRMGFQLEVQDRPDLTLYGHNAAGWKLTSRSFVLAAGIRYHLRKKEEPVSPTREGLIEP